MNDVLSLTAAVLEGCISQPERRRARGDAYAGPLWDVEVPVRREVVAKVIEYAHQQQITIGAVTGKLLNVKGTDDGLVVTIQGDVWERGVTSTTTIGYGSERERLLATGKWLPLKHGRVRLTRLMPEVVPTTYGAEIRIGAEFERPGWLSWLANTALSHIELHYTKAVPVVSGRLKTWLLPDIKFVEPVAGGLK